MSSDLIQQRLLDWKKNPEFEFRLERLGLKQVPQEIIESEIPITRLSLFSNKLTTIPKSFIENHPNIETLDLSCNSFQNQQPKSKQFIECLGSLKNLQSLQFAENEIPEPILFFITLQKLKKLEKLDLRKTNMKFVLGDCLCSLSRCINIKSLVLSECGIHGFPAMLRSLDHLEVLDVSFNYITTLEICLFSLFSFILHKK